MTSEDSSESNEGTAQNHPLLVAQRSNFQWTVVFDAADLVAGWQDRLTRYLVATTTASVSFEGQEPLHLNEVKVLDDPLNLYQIDVHEQAVDVQVYYRSLSQMFMDTPYDCHLLLKTEVGGRFVIIPAPKPPSQAEWKQLLKKLWFQLLLAEDALLVTPDAPHASTKGKPLYTFKLHSELDWEEAASLPAGGTLSEWQRELRLAFDPADPDALRAQVGWNDSMSVSNPALERVLVTRSAHPPAREGQTRKRRSSEIRGWEGPTVPVPTSSLPGQGRRWGFSRARVAALTAAILLLGLIGVLAIGATRGTPRTDKPATVLNPSPTNGVDPSAIPSPTASSTSGPAASPVSTPKVQPTSTSGRSPSKPTPAPTPTPAHGPSPSPTPTSTNTPTPTPTDTPTPTPTDTPTPPPTDTPTPPPTDTPIPTPTDTPPPALTDTPTDTPTPATLRLVSFPHVVIVC